MAARSLGIALIIGATMAAAALARTPPKRAIDLGASSFWGMWGGNGGSEEIRIYVFER